jgi:hypothetical protein
VLPASAWIAVSSADFIAAALVPIGSGAKIARAAGIVGSKLEPNSTAPSLVAGSRTLISRSIACTRSRLESVRLIEPESSMIASMFVAFLHAAAACARGSFAELGAATATTARPPTMSPSRLFGVRIRRCLQSWVSLRRDLAGWRTAGYCPSV